MILLMHYYFLLLYHSLSPIYIYIPKRLSVHHLKTHILFQGNAPFVKRDVTSKSAILGVGQDQGNHYWNHKNPNAVGRKTGNRKKKTK